MSAKTMIYKGEACNARRVDVYVKRGAYAHGHVKGWELCNDAGAVVVDSQPSRASSAYEYQAARFPTLSSLRSWVDSENAHVARWEERRRALKGDA